MEPHIHNIVAEFNALKMKLKETKELLSYTQGELEETEEKLEETEGELSCTKGKLEEIETEKEHLLHEMRHIRVNDSYKKDCWRLFPMDLVDVLRIIIDLDDENDELRNEISSLMED
jgi:predicted nuclease with TOPRIM domain